MKGISLHLLTADFITRMLLYIAAIAAIAVGIASQGWWLVGTSAALLLTYLACRILILYQTARDLDERRYYVSTILFDIIRPFWELYFRLCLWIMPKDMHMRRK